MEPFASCFFCCSLPQHPRQPVPDGNVGQGQEDGGQHIAHPQLLLGQAQHIDADAHDDGAAHGAHLVDDGGVDLLAHQTEDEGHAPLIHQDGQGGEGHADAHGGGEGDGGNTVHHGLGDQDVVVAVHARLHGPVDGHGPHAEEDRGGDKALHKPTAAILAEQPALEQPSHAVHPALDVDGLPQQGADHHAHDDAQGVCRADHTGDADAHGAQTQGEGDPRGKPGTDAVFEQQAQYAAQQHQDHIDDGGDHRDSSLLYCNSLKYTVL